MTTKQPTIHLTISVPANAAGRALCSSTCPGLWRSAPYDAPSCTLFPRKADGHPRWLKTDHDRNPKRCHQCQKAEVK